MGRARGWGGCPALQRSAREPARGAVMPPIISLLVWSLASTHLLLDTLCVCSACPTLCDPMDCSPPGCSVHAVLQARTLEWVFNSSSKGSPLPRDQTQVSCIGGRTLDPCTV